MFQPMNVRQWRPTLDATYRNIFTTSSIYRKHLISFYTSNLEILDLKGEVIFNINFWPFKIRISKILGFLNICLISGEVVKVLQYRIEYNHVIKYYYVERRCKDTQIFYPTF